MFGLAKQEDAKRAPCLRRKIRTCCTEISVRLVELDPGRVPRVLRGHHLSLFPLIPVPMLVERPYSTAIASSSGRIASFRDPCYTCRPCSSGDANSVGPQAGESGPTDRSFRVLFLTRVRRSFPVRVRPRGAAIFS